MSSPSITDLSYMGWTYNGEPFLDQDAVVGLTSPGYMGIAYRGEPVTFNFSPLTVPVFISRAILSRAIRAGGMGLKPPHFP